MHMYIHVVFLCIIHVNHTPVIMCRTPIIHTPRTCNTCVYPRHVMCNNDLHNLGI